MNPTHSRISLVFVAFAPLAAMAAEDRLNEVVISATLAETPLALTPSSVTVLNADQLGAAGLAHFGDVTSLVPNLGFAGGTSRTRYFQIRGIGELENYEGAPNSSVGFLIDDIDFSGIAMPAALFDLKQVEVLRGPQGTAYGANAIAGLISLQSQAPRQGFDAFGVVEAGNYETWSAGVVLNNSTADDRTAWRLGVHHTSSDGFRHNVFLDRDDTNGFDEDFVRLRLRSHLTDMLDLNVTALYADADNGYDAWSIDNSRVTRSDDPGVDAQLSRALAVRFDYGGWDGVSLRSVSTILDADMDYSFDGDWVDDTYWGADDAQDFTEVIGRKRRNISQEFRLRGIQESGDWVAGVYALQLREHYAILDMYNGDVYRALDSNFRALTLAAYGQVDRQLGGGVVLSTGLRVERRDARYRDSNNHPADPVDTMVGGHLALTREFSPGQSAYVALTRGYKAGGVNTTAEDISADLRNFDPEFLWNLELGLRTNSADGAFDSRTSLFYMRRTNQQVSSSVQSDPENPLTFVLLTDNAARGDNIGLESELGWNASRVLRFEATVGLLKARFLDYTRDEGTPDEQSLDKRDIPHAPNYQLGLAANWRSPSGWFARAAFQAVDAFYFSASHEERAPSYQLVNLLFGYERDRWNASLYARNVLDEHYAVRGFFFANEPPDWEPKRYIQNGDPRQIGLRVSFNF
ncbi:MAG: TonB-dependent receptor plug domain-containing protein [Pseudomonadota bacterium]